MEGKCPTCGRPLEVSLPAHQSILGLATYRPCGRCAGAEGPAAAGGWREADGVIYFTVTSDGTTGEGWVERLENGGFRVSWYAKSVLRSPDFAPTSGVAREIAVLGGALFADGGRTTENVRREAKRRRMAAPNAEVACLAREMLSDGDLGAMGLRWIAVMHEPIEDSVGDSSLLALRVVDGRWLHALFDRPADRWLRDGGFAFAVPQAGAQG